MTEFLAFLDTHIQLIGWPALLAIAWKASRFTASAQSRIVAAEATIFSLATNHLPHIEEAVREVTTGVEKGFARVESAIANLSVQILVLANRPIILTDKD